MCSMTSKDVMMSNIVFLNVDEFIGSFLIFRSRFLHISIAESENSDPNAVQPLFSASLIKSP